jgi:peroxiredoxin Q/BCP
MLKEGDLALPFRVLADNGKEFSLDDYLGRDLVIFFFPKANTPG